MHSWMILSIHCTGSPFVDKDHIHIIRANLRKYEDTELCKFFSKVLQYRENKMSYYQKAKENIIMRIMPYI